MTSPARPAPYSLTLTADCVRAIAFVGSRYGWSDALYAYGEGTHTLTECEAWTIREAIESDTIGGHERYPMLSGRSALAEELDRLLDSIV